MSIIPIITFKAGICKVDISSKPHKVKADHRPGFIYLYLDDDLVHFCWRPRDRPLDQPELDLVMVPTDGHFVPYDTHSPAQATAKTNGRIFVLKFGSSSSRHIFWLQSKPQAWSGNPAWFSPRDLKIGTIVDALLQGEEVDVNAQLASVRNDSNDDSRRDGGQDTTMEDAGSRNHDEPQGGSGGAGADATGGDVRYEGETAREGGADGARAAACWTSDAATVVRKFLDSLKGATGSALSQQGKVYPALKDLLEASVTVPMIDAASEDFINCLLSFFPPSILVLARGGDNEHIIDTDSSAQMVFAAQASLNSGQKRDLLRRVLRSPQFSQSLVSLTMAVRDSFPALRRRSEFQSRMAGSSKVGTCLWTVERPLRRSLRV